MAFYSAMNFMFDGMPFNCDVHEFAAKAVCAAIEGEGKQVFKVNDTHMAVSLLGKVSE